VNQEIDDDELNELIILSNFRFPEHWMIQDWLSRTEYGDEFKLGLVEIRQKDRNGDWTNSTKTTPVLEPLTPAAAFKWKLKGIDALEQKILDFHKR